MDGAQMRAWCQALQRSHDLLARLRRERGWRREVLADLQIGFDGERITVPIWQPHRDSDERGRLGERQHLQGVLRLRVDRTQHPKVIAMPGTRLGLIPAPTRIRERELLLVEGPSDLLAARSAGLPAVAVPGANAWRPEWAASLHGRMVVVVMDCDRAGRQAAQRIGEDLQRRGVRVRISDLDPAREDGYDLSDWLRAGNPPAQLTRSSDRMVVARRQAASSPSRSAPVAAASRTIERGARSVVWSAF